ncbi:hypothetical protein VP501E541_P0165 [Vibrio phage 501E54-1]|nr:hypothetical protein VP501E541_P0165 [Vibrio phage 501E54-1]
MKLHNNLQINSSSIGKTLSVHYGRFSFYLNNLTFNLISPLRKPPTPLKTPIILILNIINSLP